MKYMRGKRLLILCGGCAVVLCIGWLLRSYLEGPTPEGAPTPPPEGGGWLALFDSAHADHWENITDDKDIFDIEEGVLHLYGRTIYPLRYVGYTGQEFGDFDLHIEFRVARRANSGLFLRAHPEDPVYRGFEIQILDDHGKPPDKNGTGSIYDVVTPMFNLARPAGEWNSYDVRVRGTEVSVTVNGWKVVDTDFSQMDTPLGKFDVPFSELPRSGLIALQDHGGEAWFRNLLLRPATAAN